MEAQNTFWDQELAPFLTVQGLPLLPPTTSYEKMPLGTESPIRLKQCQLSGLVIFETDFGFYDASGL